jgi:3-hydroxy-9,10-secoandrosta-1,3,5(10)-triene-9,17-dione monooxygenase reductase component
VGSLHGVGPASEASEGNAQTLAGTSVTPPNLRLALGCFPTGVTIVAGMLQGRPVGMTANSFTSVSLEPPLVLFCAKPWSATLESVRRSGAFVVNVLGEDEQELSHRFACDERGQGGRFMAVGYELGETGSPILRRAVAWLDCLLEAEHPGGDHVIVVGRAVRLGIPAPDRAPLVFCRSRYDRLAAPAPAAVTPE